MRRGPWQRSVVALVAVAVLALSGVTAIAQDSSLPAEIRNAESLGQGATSTIRQYADVWGQRLAAGGAEAEVRRARTLLVEPLSFGTSNAFRSAYSQAVTPHIEAAMQSSQMLPRLNAMIVASRLEFDPSLLQVVRAGTQDQSPAVRYWAVKALAGRVASMPPDLQREVLQDLETLLDRESNEPVLEQSFQAMVELNLPGNQAILRVLEALNRRIQVHVENPRMPYRAEMIGLRNLYQRLLTMQAGQGAGVNEAFTQIARVAQRYFDLVTRQGAAHAQQAPPATLESYLQMADLTFTILSGVHRQANSTVSVPASIERSLAQQNWNELRQAADRFRNALASPPFNLPEEELVVQPQ